MERLKQLTVCTKDGHPLQVYLKDGPISTKSMNTCIRSDDVLHWRLPSSLKTSPVCMKCLTLLQAVLSCVYMTSAILLSAHGSGNAILINIYMHEYFGINTFMGIIKPFF